jgi:hypothetical protein
LSRFGHRQHQSDELWQFDSILPHDSASALFLLHASPQGLQELHVDVSMSCQYSLAMGFVRQEAKTFLTKTVLTTLSGLSLLPELPDLAVFCASPIHLPFKQLRAVAAFMGLTSNGNCASPFAVVV